MKTIMMLSIISVFMVANLAIPCYGQEDQQPTSQWPYPIADQGTYTSVLFDLLEYQRIRDVNALRWDIAGWSGGDKQRFWFKSEGALYPEEIGGGEFDIQALYGKLIWPFFDLQAGLRFEQHYEPDSSPTRVFAVIGLQGLAPYGFEIDPELFLSNKGKLSARFTATHDTLFTQQLILQSRFETELAAQKDDEFGVERGINDIELGFRLRYEISRKFAPYVGVSYRQSFGAAKDRVLREGGDPNQLQFVAGMRMWF